ncbi:MAG TPA: ATP-binding protein, partial [Anaerolineae bacterium]
KYLLGVSIDITELKQAEEALLIQQKRLRSLYEITTQPEQEVDQQFKMALEAGAILLDLDSGIISQIEDDNYTVIHCYAPSDPLQPGQTFELGQTYCDLTFKADQVIGIDHAGQSEYSGHPCYRALQLEAYLGVPLWVNGQRFGTLNFSSLSPRKTPFNEADQDFVRLMGQWVSATLEREQAALALAQARDQALEASRLKSQLLARVSHELRNPLSAILGYAELLENSVFGPLSDPQLKATTHIIDGTYYLTHLVNELLDQAQFESGKITLAINPFDLMDMVNQVENKMTVLARAKGLTFSMDIAADLPSTLVGDQKRLQQILINLIGNAIKFTKSGGVQAHLYRADPAYWTIQVTDTGIGIPPEIQPYIFEPFHQGDGSITREYGGSGLGLAIVKQLVALMNGDVTLESEIGQGSIFTVTLPF